MALPRIYLDNAATSWPKPESVYAAMDAYQRVLGAPVGRGAYREAVQAAHLVDEARRSVAELLGGVAPRRIIFTLNGTDALNLAIHGVLRAGDHVVTSDAEHNSVLRPLRHAEQLPGIDVTRVGCDATGRIDPDDVARALRDNTRLVVLTHASNVTGTIQPLAEVGNRLQDHPALFLVDAAQTLGHLPLTASELQADLIAAPGHKGLLGPLGTGILYCGPKAESQIVSRRQGGTGTLSEVDRQPTDLPERLEAGNLNVPGIVGLAAGIGYLVQRRLEQVRADELLLADQLLEGLRDIPQVTVYGPDERQQRVGLVSVTLASYDPQEVAAALDGAYGIQVRAGLHCAARMHQTLGTDFLGGTVRFSIGPFTTSEDIASTVAAVAEIASAALPT